MGSLMAGWDSPISDPKTVSLERNKSFTKEEIDNFWRSRKTSKHQHHQYFVSAESPEFSFDLGPLVFQDTQACKIRDWWTQSNWAFLNQPPTEAHKSASNYVAQFHVAQLPAKNKKGSPATYIISLSYVSYV